MKLPILFILSFLFLLTSCRGQSTEQPAKTDKAIVHTSTGDTVAKLGNNIMTVYQDRKNNYWFGSWEDGLYKSEGNTILHYTTKNGLPHHRVEDIQEDKWGYIYINTPGGVCKFDGQTFSILPVRERGEWKLHPDDLWFKSLQFSGQVFRYDGKDLYSLQLPETTLGKEWTSKHPTYSNPYGVYTIYKDSKGNIWFGTAALGACRYNGKSFDWISEEDVTELHDGPANGVRSIIEDKDGYFWFNSAYRYAVYEKRNANQHPFYRRENSIGNLDGSPDSDFWEYMSIARDNNNALWIATYGNGVWKYGPVQDGNEQGKHIIHYPVLDKGKDITLFSIYKDNAGNIWLGTHENGVYKFNGQTFERFNP